MGTIDPEGRPETRCVSTGALVTVVLGRCCGSNKPSSSRKPIGYGSVRFQWRQAYPTESPFAVDQDALVVVEAAELVGLQPVFLGLGIVDITLAAGAALRTLHDAFLAENVGGLDGLAFVGDAEDHSVTRVQGEDFGFVVADGWNQKYCRPNVKPDIEIFTIVCRISTALGC